MEKGYLLRIIFDSEKEDVYKDILFRSTDVLNSVQDVLVQRFGLDLGQAALFSLADDSWEKYEDFDSTKHRLCDAIFRKGDRLVFSYGEYDNWKFLIELLSLHTLPPEAVMPVIIEEYGMLPEQADSDNYDPDSFIVQNSKAGYKDKPVAEDDEEEDLGNDKDIWEYF